MGDEPKKPERRPVARPDYVVLQRHPGAQPQILANVAAAVVTGGEKFPGNGYRRGDKFGKTFSFGYRAPARVEIVMGSGKRASLAGAFQILFCGGQEGGEDLLGAVDKMLKMPAPRVPATPLIGNAEIADTHPSDVIDSGVSQQIVDRKSSDPDDFDLMVSRRNRLLTEAEGDDFLALANLQAAQHSDFQAEAPFARTNQPPSASGAILGGQASLQLQVGDTTDLIEEVCTWQGNDVETTPVTVILGSVGNIVAKNQPARAPIRSYAIVNVGTRGYLIPIRVDIGLGCQFTIAASQVRVQLALDATSIDWTSINITSAATLTAMLSFLTTQKQSAVTCTQYLNSLANGVTSAVQQVPVFAKAVRVAVSDTTSTFTLVLLDSSLNDVEVINISGTSPITFSGDVFAATLKNNGPNSASARLIWYLEL